ncbi:MAG: endonuclease/exonuclease/phosphatase family protein [Gammaproteobacteria bacterium]
MRVATFNIENLDDKLSDGNPELDRRIPVLRKMLLRLKADVLCLQEVHGQELPDHTASHPSRNLSALDRLLQETPYADYHRAHTVTSDNVPYNVRNLVVLSRYPILSVNQYRNDLIPDLQYRKVTANPAETVARDLGWERPILHATLDHPSLGDLHVINLHLKSRLATHVAGQKVNTYTWRSAAGWAEGYFLSSVKRVGQALEARILIDSLFDENPAAPILVCGDFNAEPGEVPVEAIAGRVENTGNPDLRDRVLIPCSLAIPDSVRFSHLHHGHGNLLDHLLISQSLLPYFEQAVIYNENLHDESLPFMSDIKYPESDHAPFVAQFALADT